MTGAISLDDALRRARSEGIQDAADLVAAKDHRTDLGDDPHATGWRQALNEVEQRLRRLAVEVAGPGEPSGIEQRVNAGHPAPIGESGHTWPCAGFYRGNWDIRADGWHPSGGWACTCGVGRAS